VRERYADVIQLRYPAARNAIGAIFWRDRLSIQTPVFPDAAHFSWLFCEDNRDDALLHRSDSRIGH
jgi:hypothetical protein